MLISVIICTRNRAESLRETILSIGECELPGDLSAELIIVDNGSTDHTRKVVEETRLQNMPVRYVEEPVLGQCQARNTGIRESTGEIILFTDDDVRAPRQWIEGMCRPIASGAADAVQGGVRAAAHLERAWVKGIYRSMLALVEPSHEYPPQSMVGANMAFRRQVATRIGPFQTELGPGASGLGDDTLWGFLILNAGFKLVYASDAYVEHHFDEGRLSREYFCEWARRSGESNALMSVNWLGNAPRHPRVLYGWIAAKMAVRSALWGKGDPIPHEWYLYYLLRMVYAKRCGELLAARRARARDVAVV